MKLMNVMIVVKDIEASKQFYKELFGLDVVLDQEGNAILTEGLVLQDKRIWESAIGRTVVERGHDTELYFKEADMEAFLKKLKKSHYEIEYIHKDINQSPGQRRIRIYDLDGHMIEVKESLP